MPNTSENVEMVTAQVIILNLNPRVVRKKENEDDELFRSLVYPICANSVKKKIIT